MTALRGQRGTMAIPIRNLVAFRRAILSTKPPHAGAYFLLSEERGRWPRLGGYVFDPFELDPEIPTGTYRVYYVSTQTSGIPLPTEHGRPSADVEWQNPKSPASEDEDEAAAEVADQLASTEELQLASNTQKTELKTPTRIEDAAQRRHRREVEQERFARDIADSRLLLGQKMRHAGESAELLVVLRSYRTELEKASRMPMALSQEYLEAAKRNHSEYNGMLMDMLKKNNELATQLVGLQKAQPPPPPPSLLAQIASPEGLSFAKFVAEVITGRGGSDSDTVTATEEDPDLKRLRKKRDEARAKLKRLQSASKKAAGSKEKEGSRTEERRSRPKPQAGKRPKKKARIPAKPEAEPAGRKAKKQATTKSKPAKPRSRPIKGELTGGDGK